MALEKYRKKRDFEKTPEPPGSPRPDGGRLYVIQKHAARRLHYDFRLELDGVLVSWAVPKGPSLDPQERHLAVHVEDHPVEYGSFEGTIPKGEYGAGTVELWDRGTWEPEGDPRAGLAKGDLKFTLQGEKLKGAWVLAKMKARSEEEGKDEWLLIKRRDEHAVEGGGQAILSEQAQSVASGRTLEEITRDAGSSVWHSDRPADQQTEVRPAEEIRLDASLLAGAKQAAEMPRFLKPEFATLVDKAPEGGQWLHEIKLDGYRAIARIEAGTVEMFSRNDKDWTAKFRPVADALAKLPVNSAMLDGEVVVQLPDGTTSFQALQNELSGRKDRLLYYVFDLLYLDGYDLTGVAVEERKALLERLVARTAAGGRVRYSDHAFGEGKLFWEQACNLGLEGAVSKKRGSLYRPGVRGREWLKTKCLHQQEFVIGGYTDPAGKRIGFGALLLGTYERGKLRYVGKVGTGYTEKTLHELSERLGKLETDKPPFEEDVKRTPKGSHWVRPELVAEVAFMEWTRDGDIRHPSFKGLREDKQPSEVVEERAKPLSAVAPESREESQPANAKVRGVRLTNPDRVFWPAEQVTKRQLVEYYEDLAEHMLPYVLHRPVSMVRCPQGVAGVAPEFHEEQGGPCFFHKHAGPEFPGPFQRVEIVESEGPGTYLTITEAGSLIALAQMGVLEIHIWGSRWPDIEHPDMIVFDLDPDPAVGWPGVVEGAHLVRTLLQELGLQSFVKTTGGKGLHVVTPIKPSDDWEGVKRFAKAVADGIVTFAPEQYTSSMSKAKRRGKTFVDYLRNSRTATFIAPYSTRAKDRATISVPLRWEDLSGDVRADSYTIKNLRRRLAALKGDPWEGFLELQHSQRITEQVKREIGLG